MTKTLDLSSKTWGNDYVYDPLTPDGLKASLMGWSTPLPQVGDYVILKGRRPGETTCYQIDSVSYFNDPKDMFSAKVSFAPRESKEPEERHLRFMT